MILPYHHISAKTLLIAGILSLYMASIGCSDNRETKENIDGASRMGHERALELKATTTLDTLRIESILIDVREREHRLRAKGHDRIADAYIKAFLSTLDSVDPSLAAELR